jgi:6-phosphogluconolactonase
MKLTKKISMALLCLLSLAACKKEGNLTGSSSNPEDNLSENDDFGRNTGSQQFLFTQSNQTSQNSLLVYKRTPTGQLQYFGTYLTGGTGTGGGLGNQGAVTITENGRAVIAVNAGSNSISIFKITPHGLRLACTVGSGGIRPVSVTQSGRFVYVLNAGGDGNISGFTVDAQFQLEPINNSIRPLSSNMAGAAQISFTRNGKVLVITEKATNKIISYTVNNYGIPESMHSITSANSTPFGFASGKFGNIYVSEAAGGSPNASTVSSYKISPTGNITLTDGPVATNQTAACWVVLTKNNRYAYTTNTASNTISSFAIHPLSGNTVLQNSIASTSQAGPIDASISKNSKFLYVLNGTAHSISSYTISTSGALNLIQTIEGLPMGANGLASE